MPESGLYYFKRGEAKAQRREISPLILPGVFASFTPLRLKYKLFSDTAGGRVARLFSACCRN